MVHLGNAMDADEHESLGNMLESGLRPHIAGRYKYNSFIAKFWPP